jgi:hypothetical protein
MLHVEITVGSRDKEKWETQNAVPNHKSPHHDRHCAHNVKTV